jgi:hypothetical protein
VEVHYEENRGDRQGCVDAVPYSAFPNICIVGTCEESLIFRRTGKLKKRPVEILLMDCRLRCSGMRRERAEQEETMHNSGIYDDARKLAQRVGSADPQDYLDYLNIIYKPADYFPRLKGMYVADWRRCFIYINTNCGTRMQRMVKFHEIGHHILHRETNCIFKEFELYNMANDTELEANVFAASILMPDDVIYDYAHDGGTIGQIASLTGMDMNLVLIKMHDMQRRGFDLRVSDYGKSDFLK